MSKAKMSLLAERKANSNKLDGDFQRMFGINPDSKGNENEIVHLPLNKLIPFKNHPFNLYNKDKLDEMVESIRNRGVDSPVIVRKTSNDYFEIIAGHNRTEASRIAGCETVPSIIMEVDDDTAVLMMTDSNLLQRDRILPSERGRAYKMQMDTLSRQGQRTDLTLYQNDTKIDTLNILAKKYHTSRVQISRFIRMTELIPELSYLVDNNKLNFGIAVDLSYLSAEHQKTVLALLNKKDYILTSKNAAELKKMARSNSLTIDKIVELLAPIPRPKTEVKISYKKLSRFNIPDEQMQEVIIKALEMYFANATA